MDDLELYKSEFSENFSRFCRFWTQQQLNEWRQTSTVSDNVSTSKWSNCWHAFATRGFVSNSWAFLFFKLLTKWQNQHHSNIRACHCWNTVCPVSTLFTVNYWLSSITVDNITEKLAVPNDVRLSIDDWSCDLLLGTGDGCTVSKTW